MKYLPISTPTFDQAGVRAEAPVMWYVGVHRGEHKLMTCENTYCYQSHYPAIAVPEATEAAIRGWQHGIADTEPDEALYTTYERHEGFREPSFLRPEATDVFDVELARLWAIYERQYAKAVEYVRNQIEQEQNDND